jgi:hypothetical protein
MYFPCDSQIIFSLSLSLSMNYMNGKGRIDFGPKHYYMKTFREIEENSTLS